MKPINAAMFIGGRTSRTYGSKFTYTVEPSQPIIGKITDIETGNPVAGVLVESTASSGSSGYASAVTNEKGEYRLEGMPKNKRYRLNIKPRAESPYFARRYFEVNKVAAGLKPTKADFKLRRTQWYSGRIVDKTGNPVQARIVYSPRIDNKAAEQYASFVKGRFSTDSFSADGPSVTTNMDGKFRIRVIPGDGMLFVVCNEPHCTGFGRDSLDERWWGDREIESNPMTNTYQPMYPQSVHRLWPIKIGEAPDERTHDITVDPGQSLDVQLVDPNDKPLSGVTVVGRVPRGLSVGSRPVKEDHLQIKAITPDNPREVFFYHEQRDLGAFLVVPGKGKLEGNKQRTVRLAPCATLKGRLLDQAGKPISNAPIGINPVEVGDDSRRFVVGRTGKDGNFAITRIVPDALLSFYEMSTREGALILEASKLKPGETRDLGEVKVEADAPARRQYGFSAAEEEERKQLKAAERRSKRNQTREPPFNWLWPNLFLLASPPKRRSKWLRKKQARCSPTRVKSPTRMARPRPVLMWLFWRRNLTDNNGATQSRSPKRRRTRTDSTNLV